MSKDCDFNSLRQTHTEIMLSVRSRQIELKLTSELDTEQLQWHQGGVQHMRYWVDHSIDLFGNTVALQNRIWLLRMQWESTECTLRVGNLGCAHTLVGIVIVISVVLDVEKLLLIRHSIL